MKVDDYALGFDAVAFAREVLGITPDLRQAEILRSRAKRGILNCSRQWGKSTITAAMAVHRAWFDPGSLVLVLSPTARQSGEFMDKVWSFARRLEVKKRGDGHNGMSQVFPNGSRVVGVPGVQDFVGIFEGFAGVDR